MKLNFLIIILFFISCNKNNDNKITETKPKRIIPEFNSDNAWQYLVTQTNFGPRNPNSIGHKNTLQFLSDEISKFADTVIYQNFLHNGYNERLNFTNIFASFNLENKNRILLLAHWDTRPRAENDILNKNKPIIGANDGASGIAVLLEIANILKNNKLDYGVDILLTDGEDYGKPSDLDNYSIGAKHFIKNININYQPKFAILLDMVGDKFLNIPIEVNSNQIAPEIINNIWNIASELGVTQFENTLGSEIYDDHIPLIQAGIPTIDIIDFDYKHWHTQNDLPKNCSQESLNAVGKVLTTFLYKYNF